MSIITRTEQHTATDEQVKAAEWLASLMNELGIPTGDGDADMDILVNRRGFIGGICYTDEMEELLKVNAGVIATRAARVGYAFTVRTRTIGTGTDTKDFVYVSDRPINEGA